VDPQRARELLEAERAQQEAILAAGEEGDFGEEEQERSSDLLDAGTQPQDAPQVLYEDEQEQSFREHARAKLREVEHALRKLDDGSYGLDERTGEPIPDERLEAMPTARFTIENQKLEEARADVTHRGDGDVTSTRLGGRQPS